MPTKLRSSPARAFIQPFRVALFTDSQRRIDINLDTKRRGRRALLPVAARRGAENKYRQNNQASVRHQTGTSPTAGYSHGVGIAKA